MKPTIPADGMKSTTTPFSSWTGVAANLALCLVLTTAARTTLAAEPGASQRTVTVYVQLEGEPAAVVAAGPQPAVALASTASRAKLHAAGLQAQQARLGDPLQSLGGRITGRFTRVANALRIQMAEDQLPRLATLPGVKRIERARFYQRLLTTTLPFVGAPAVWSHAALPVDGRGVRVGVIDSGIDYTHADFGGPGTEGAFGTNDPTRIEPGTFPTAKVVGGFDFAGDAYNPGDEGHQTPQPDPDPLDCSGNGHGTHVAGILAGLGVLKNGQPYTGVYSSFLDLAQFSIGPGVAPKAELYALKVFGCEGTSGLVTDALEWAADPNGDYDFSDRLDVVNLSLGGDFGSLDPESTDVSAANRLAELGCVVVCAAGNSENTFFAVSSPAVAERAIAVANSIVQGKGSALEVLSPPSVARKLYFVEGAITQPLTNTGPVSGKLVDATPNLACEALSNAAQLNGNVALIDRGTCFFADKIRRAQDAGAIAVIMVNNLDTSPIAMGGEGSGIRIPGVMISKADGALLKAHGGETITVRLDAETFIDRPEFVDTLDDGSSRGPGSPFTGLKPDISAPGVDLVSAKAGAGSQSRSLSGTSMASPVVAGAAALLRQLHPSWTVEDIKAALLNTTKPILNHEGEPYPESRMGSGRLQLTAAAQTQLTAFARDSQGAVAVSFGRLALSKPHQENREIMVRNHGDTPVTCTVAVSNSLPQVGIEFTAGPDTLTVPARGSAILTLQMKADPNAMALVPDPTTEGVIGAGTPLPRHFLFETSGAVWLHGGAVPVHVPFHVNARPASDYEAATTTLIPPASGSTTLQPDLTIPFQGAAGSTNLQPLLSAFQLGATSPHKRLTDPNRAAADLLAVGTATDVHRVSRFSESTVYFGVACAAPWTTPQPDLVLLQLLIDVDRDGYPDFEIHNDNASATNSGGGKDVFMTVVHELSRGFDILDTNAVSLVNIHPPDALDTALFNSSVMVLPVPAVAMGLTPSASTFRYRIITYAPSGSVDETGWIPFDAARPVIDTVAAHPEALPMYDDGLPLVVRLDREAAARQGQRLPSVLILHHLNAPGRQSEIVTIDLSNDDRDQDGLFDWWEQQQFAGLTAADQASDFDGDGAPDRHEFIAGTNPKNPQSVFRLLSATRVSRNNIAVRWTGLSGRRYMLERSTNLVQGFTETVRDDILDTSPLNSITDTNAPAPGPYFYRVRLKE